MLTLECVCPCVFLIAKSSLELLLGVKSNVNCKSRDLCNDINS